jgi:hypothetical protein
VLDPHLQFRRELLLDGGRELLDVVVVGEVRHAEPRRDPCLVAQCDHELERHALARLGRIVGARPVGPGALLAVVGRHPVHEPHGAELPHAGHERGVERRRRRIVGERGRQDADPAHGVGRIGGPQLDHQRAACRDREVVAAGPLAGHARVALELQFALSVVTADVAPWPVPAGGQQDRRRPLRAAGCGQSRGRRAPAARRRPKVCLRLATPTGARRGTGP